MLGAGWFRCLTGTGSLCPSPPTHPCTRLYHVCVFQLLSRDTGICSCNCTSCLRGPERTTESLAAAALHLWSLVWGHKLQCESVAVSTSCKQGHLITQPQEQQGRRPPSQWADGSIAQAHSSWMCSKFPTQLRASSIPCLLWPQIHKITILSGTKLQE